MKHTILVADNHKADREKWGAFLHSSGFKVYLASTPQEARTELARNKIDLAVIDMRLEDDNLETDISGLRLAADKAFRHIPKIILTGFTMSYDDQRKVLRMIDDDPPPVVTFVGKAEGPQVLLNEILETMEEWPRFTMLASKVSEQIKMDHKFIRNQAKWYSVASLVLSIIGFFLIVGGIIGGIAFTSTLMGGRLTIGVIGTAAGLILESLGYLFFKQMEIANKRMDNYHQELLQTYGIEFLLSIAQRLPSIQENTSIEKMICAVINSWYPQNIAERPVLALPNSFKRDAE